MQRLQAALGKPKVDCLKEIAFPICQQFATVSLLSCCKEKLISTGNAFCGIIGRLM
jgi:hypothetical protein